MVRGDFREDHYRRLNAIRLRAPAQRERRGDVPALLVHFLKRPMVEMANQPKRLHPDVVARLTALDWPGNVRQLENLCRWLTVMAPDRKVVLADPPEDLRASATARETGQTAGSETGLRQWAQERLAAGRGSGS